MVMMHEQVHNSTCSSTVTQCKSCVLLSCQESASFDQSRCAAKDNWSQMNFVHKVRKTETINKTSNR